MVFDPVLVAILVIVRARSPGGVGELGERHELVRKFERLAHRRLRSGAQPHDLLGGTTEQYGSITQQLSRHLRQ